MDDDIPRIDQIPQFIRQLMPDASEAALQAAHENMKQYLGTVRSIRDRLKGVSPAPDSGESLGRSRV